MCGRCVIRTCRTLDLKLGFRTNCNQMISGDVEYPSSLTSSFNKAVSSNLYGDPKASVFLPLEFVISAVLSCHCGYFHSALSLACHHQELHVITRLMSLSNKSKEEMVGQIFLPLTALSL